MTALVAVALGGALGGACRYLATRALDRHLSTAFPWATFLVNMSGAFLAGSLAQWLTHHGDGQSPAGLLLLVGFLGSYTTVSSWSLQTLALMRQSLYGHALANLLLTTLAGLIAVVAGVQLARVLGVWL